MSTLPLQSAHVSTDKIDMPTPMQTPELDRYLRHVADVYDIYPHMPTDEITVAHYKALKSELLNQFQLLSAFVNVSFTPVDPYGNSAEMFESIRRGSLAVYTGGELPEDHPFSERTIGGITFNSIFRAVHDGIAHYPERNNFGKLGEFRAFRAHARLLSWASIQALFTETVGQNAWYHFGPQSKRRPRPFAPQKATLLPNELIVEALTIPV